MNELQSRIVALFPGLKVLREPAWIVGGAVRDLLRGVEPPDVDIALDSAAEVAARFASRTGGRLVEMGRPPLASIRVVVEESVYDFAPIQGVSIDEDLGRRDYTINALAFPLHGGGVIDPHGGCGDIQRGLLRAVAARNLDDDPLRVLRGIRFAQCLELTVEEKTRLEMMARAPRLSEVAPERVTFELGLILEGAEPERGLRLIHDLGIDVVIFGRRVGIDRIGSIASMPAADAIALLSILLADLADQQIVEVSEHWRWPAVWRNGVLAVRSILRVLAETDHSDLPILVHEFGSDTSARAAAWLFAAGEKVQSESLRRVVEDRGAELEAKRALLDGREISELTGTPPGPKIGRIKRALVEAEIRGEVTSRDEAVTFVVKSESRLEDE